MTRRTVFAVILCVLILSLGLSAQEGEHAAEPHGESGSSGMLGKVINFVILFGALGYLLAKPIMNFLSKRTTDIRASLDGARSAREEAARKLAETQVRIAALEGEAARLKSEAEAEGLRAELEGQAGDLAARIEARLVRK